ncbi:DNA polymerase III subunit gamma/tau [Desulfopila aestuarii]|uniref:DNA polymerase III subunit gamma/tau n=1 Tax=Desulfopila aestuarii DSM 18488 TaxID=1121416 RepID=A0A1M7YKJ5_9BACT|nr:DNA polymerase III subunit gamma/tau [Desulfopila aestuarii]SHO53144.1 DNA polymerase III, tau subunit [Desulfopila aestuarii DSM 18488]
MSYLVLARKSRPQTFDQVVGQRSVVKTLQNSLARNRVAHAILFSGVRGVGKTTLARIMAKAINCEGNGDNRPCNACNPCRDIMTGSSLDLIEIDGASNRGIQEIRELKEKIKFLPTSCKYKIIIIDEVHMLTTEAFNALLKTLEEPPEHVYFMFATTELHKIPITILSRCQQYELKRIPAAELGEHFEKLALQEEVEIEPKALSLIVREAEGSVRDGLSLLDQVFSFGEKKISIQDVTEVLGLVNRDILWQLSEALLTGDRTTALKSLEDIFAFGMDIKRFSSDLLECFRTLLLTRIEGCSELLDIPAEELHRCRDMAARFSPETIHQKLNLLMRMVEDIRYSSQPRLALETGFLKIIEAGNIVAVTDILGKLQQLLGSDGQSSASRPAVTVAPPAPKAATTSPPPAQPSQPVKKKITSELSPEPPDYGEIPLPEEENGNNTPHEPFSANRTVPQPAAAVQKSVAEVHATPKPTPATTVPEVHAHAKDIRKHWPEFITYVKDRIIWMAQDLNRARVKEVDGELQLHYDDPAECSLLRRKENKNQLTEFVLDFFQKELKVHFILPKVEDNPDEKNGVDSPQQKRQQLAHDPLTIMTAEIFHGQIGDIRIGPRSR